MTMVALARNVSATQRSIIFTQLGKLGPYISEQDPLHLLFGAASILGVIIPLVTCCMMYRAATTVVTSGDSDAPLALAKSIISRQLDHLTTENNQAQAQLQAQPEEHIRNQAQVQAEHLVLALRKTHDATFRA